MRLKSLSIIGDVFPCDEDVIKTQKNHIFHMCKRNDAFYFDQKNDFFGEFFSIVNSTIF